MNPFLAAAAGAAAGGAGWLLELMKTGKADLDELGKRGVLAFWVFVYFGPQVVFRPAIPRALVAIMNNESGGRTVNLLGDTSASGGPSIGLMQMYRRTAEDLGLWTPPAGASEKQARDAYAAASANISTGIRWGVAVFKQKLEDAKGNVPEAIRRYNGSGSAAEAYKQRALAFASALGWSLE